MAEFAIRAEHHVRSGERARWTELALENARQAEREPGCRSFEVLLDRNRPDHAMLYEVYESEQAWLDHMQQPHCQHFMRAVEDLLVARERRAFDLVRKDAV